MSSDTAGKCVETMSNVSQDDFEGLFECEDVFRSDIDKAIQCVYYFDGVGGEVAHYFPSLKSGTIFKVPRIWHESFKPNLTFVRKWFEGEEI